MLDGASHHKVTHSIPEGALVEIIEGANAGARLWITAQCDTSEGADPLYYLGLKSGVQRLVASQRQIRIIHDPDPIVDEAINDNQTEAC